MRLFCSLFVGALLANLSAVEAPHAFGQMTYPAFIPAGSVETEALETTLADRQECIGDFGVWPREDILKRAEKADLRPGYSARLQTWFGRVLREKIQPPNGDWKSDEWLKISSLHGRPHVYLLGRAESRDPRVSRIEVQQMDKGSYFALTIHSATLIPNREFNAKEVRALLGELLNIPADSLANLEVDSVAFEFSDDQTAVTYGKVFDARNRDPMTTVLTIKEQLAKYPADHRAAAITGPLPPLPPPTKMRQAYRQLIPEKKQQWFSPMRFCIFRGRLVVEICTIDWAGDNRPQAFSSMFKPLVDDNPKGKPRGIPPVQRPVE
jgi:hypothetical protein